MDREHLMSLPRRRELHFGDRVVWCFEQRMANIHAGFSEAAGRHPDRIALEFESRSWTYRELEEEVASAATALRSLGAAAGDRVALLLANQPEFVVLFLATQRAGCVAVPIDPRQRAPEVEHVLRDSGAVLLLHHEASDEATLEAAARLGALRRVMVKEGLGSGGLAGVATSRCEPVREPDPEAAAMILYTSGTTGRPKGAVIAHLNAAHSVIHHAGNLGLGTEDRSLIVVPLAHITGLLCGVLAPLCTGGTLILLRAFKASGFIAAAAARRMTYTIMVPAMYELCLRDQEFERADLSHWRIGHFGGATMHAGTIEALAKRLPQLQLVNGYGATEVCSPAAMWPVGGPPPPRESVGLPLPCAEIRVVDPETLVDAPPGEPGELWIRGPMVTPGYWNDPGANARAFSDGFWRSGDVGRVDENGHVYVLDRLKDLVNRGGYKVYSAEVEAVLLRHPGVTEAAVVARADPVLGERVHAFLSASQPLDETELAHWCAGLLADYKVPESWSITREPLPRTATGKLDKKILRQRLAASRPAALTGATTS
jgi:long-chain acyl-CoA synthetase